MSKKEKLKYGKAQHVYKCSREIRIQTPNILNRVYSCTDFGQNEIEYWKCIKVTKDYNFNVMQRVYYGL